jgi:hypothetical protein
MPQYDQRAAIDAVFKEFPAVRDYVDSSMAGLFYLEMGCFGDYIQRQIDTGNRAELVRCYELLRKLMLYGDTEVQNAVGVSVLEHLSVRDGKVARQWALDAMPPVLRQCYKELTCGI